MNVEKVESLLERGRPAPPPPDLRRRIVEAAAINVRPVKGPRKPRFVEVMTVAASILMLLGTVTWLLRATPPVPGPAVQEAQPFEDRRLSDQIPENATFFTWSADGKHWACVVKERPHQYAVIDGKRGQPHDAVYPPRFGADGAYAYISRDVFGRTHLTLNGVLQKQYDTCIDATWSPDGKKLAYVGVKGGRTVVVVDGKESEPYDRVDELLWSPDGTRLAYSAILLSDAFCVLDGKKGEPFDEVRDLTFSPDGKTLAYAAKEGSWVLVVGDQKWAEQDKVGRPVFSADGGTVGIAVVRDKWAKLALGPRPHTIIGGNHSGFQQVADPSFSRDGRVWAYRATAMNAKEKVAKERVVTGRGTLEGADILYRDDADTEYESVSDPVVSPDGKHVAYAAAKGSRKYLVVDGSLTQKFSLIDRISFGPNGETLAFRAGQYGKEFVVAGASRSEDFDQVLSGPVWSADGRKVAFTARIKSELWSKVLEVK